MKKEIYTIYLFDNKDEAFDSEFGTPKNLLKYIDEEPNRFNSNIAYDLEDSSGVCLECYARIQDIIQRLKNLNK